MKRAVNGYKAVRPFYGMHSDGGEGRWFNSTSFPKALNKPVLVLVMVHDWQDDGELVYVH